MREIYASWRRMPSVIRRYGLSVLFIASSLTITFLLQPHIFRTPLFLLAIIMSTWYAGMGPGLVAVLLSALSINYGFLHQQTLTIDFNDIPHLAAFVFSALFVSSWSATRKRAEDDLRRARDELETKVRERTAGLEESNEQLQTEIAERKRTEAELRESERRYRHIFQGAGVSIWQEDFSQVKAAIDDLKDRGVLDFRQYLAAHPEFIRQAIPMVQVIDVNDATIRLFEAESKDQVLVSFDSIFLPESEEVFAGELIAIAEGRISFESETILQTLKGEKLTVLFTVTFPPQPAKFDSVLVSIIDISERKRAERELWRLQLEMGRVERLATLGKMTGAIAHELGTPLNSVLGYAQLLAGEDLSESARRRLAVIETQIHRMVDIIQHYLSQSRGSAPRTRIHINDLIRETLVLLQPILQQHGLVVTTELADSPPAFLGDAVSLQRVLINLIDNAVDASAGKEPINIRTRVNPDSDDKASGVIIEIVDKGAGIPAEIMPNIFDLFVTTKSPGKGTGLGLAICQEIIKANGGTINVSSHVGQGTTVQIRLPADAK